MSTMTLVETNKQLLVGYLSQNNEILQTIEVSKQEEFKNNFLELATNDYLVSVVNPRELVKFAVSVTKIGLNINPAYKEVYIVPYNTEIRKGTPKVMLPQAIIPLNGIQERANKNGFFLRLYEVYKFDDGEIISEKEMSRKYQVQLDTTNQQWFNTHFVGFDVVLTDLRKQIPEQCKFVEASYLTFVTKQIKSESYKAQTYRHKAARRAFGDFNIPRERNIDVLIELEHLNDTTLENSSPSISKNSLEQLGLKTLQRDGVLEITGNTYGKTETLISLGFKYSDGKWVKIIETLPEQPVDTESPAKKLAIYLLSRGIHRESLGVFVKDVLRTSSADIEGINMALTNKDALDNMVDTFLSEPIVDNIPQN